MAAKRVKYSEAIAVEIEERLMKGESLRRICQSEHMPDRVTVLRWQASNSDFAARCARARDAQAELMDDLILDTAAGCTPETAHQCKVQISAYQWRAAKLLPKKYGERVTQDVNLSIDSALAERLAAGRKRVETTAGGKRIASPTRTIDAIASGDSEYTT